MSCYCDYDGMPEFHLAIERTARKEHICCECGHVIQPKERYEHVSTKWEGSIHSYKTCLPCTELRDSLAEASGGCYQYMGLREEYFEYLSNIYYRRSDIDIDEIYRRVMEKHRNGTSA